MTRTENEKTQNHLRGWFPAEHVCTLPKRSSLTQILEKEWRLTPQSVVLAFLALAAFLCFFTYLSDSWIKLALIGAALAVGGLWLVAPGKAKLALKVTLYGVLIFTICFTATETYMFENAGSPLTVSSEQPGVSFTNEQMLNVSLNQIVQNIKSTDTFKLLKFEHGNNIIPVAFELWPYNGPRSYGGFLGICFYSLDDNTYFHVYTNKGSQYVVDPGVCDRRPASPQDLTAESVNRDISQIDSIGTGWFNNQSKELAHKENENLPTIDATGMSVFIGGFGGNYSGMVVQTVGIHHLPTDDVNAPSDQGVLISQLAVNGTSTYLWVPAVIT